MSGKGGKDLLLQFETVKDSGTYETLGGLRSKSGSLSSESIDVTNHGSNEWREILDGAGIRSLDVSGSGVYTNSATLTAVEAAFFANEMRRFRIHDVSQSVTYTAIFKITSVERTGDYNNEQTYSLSLESSGPVAKSA